VAFNLRYRLAQKSQRYKGDPMLCQVGFEQIALQLLTPLSVGALFLYVRGIKADVKDINLRFQQFSDSCFERHKVLERDLGAKDVEIKTLFRKVDCKQ